MKLQMSQVKLCFLILVGLSGPMSMLVWNYNPLFFISPAPSVFTYQNRFRNKVSFIRSSRTGIYDKLVMNRAFYKNIVGPHRYKVLFNSMMKRGERLVMLDQYNVFVINFLCVYNADIKLTKVEVVRETETLKVFICNE